MFVNFAATMEAAQNAARCRRAGKNITFEPKERAAQLIII
jgi:hypothetical protein